MKNVSRENGSSSVHDILARMAMSECHIRISLPNNLLLRTTPHHHVLAKLLTREDGAVSACPRQKGFLREWRHVIKTSQNQSIVRGIPCQPSRDGFSPWIKAFLSCVPQTINASSQKLYRLEVEKIRAQHDHLLQLPFLRDRMLQAAIRTRPELQTKTINPCFGPKKIENPP